MSFLTDFFNIGRSTWIVLNNIDMVLEAMVKKKADFAGRPKFTFGKTIY
jgi:hypothetical protein